MGLVTNGIPNENEYAIMVAEKVRREKELAGNRAAAMQVYKRIADSKMPQLISLLCDQRLKENVNVSLQLFSGLKDCDFIIKGREEAFEKVLYEIYLEAFHDDKSLAAIGLAAPFEGFVEKGWEVLLHCYKTEGGNRRTSMVVYIRRPGKTYVGDNEVSNGGCIRFSYC